MSFQNHIRLALHTRFLKSYSRMPKEIQKKTQDFLKGFKTKATSNSVNYEPISTFKDAQMRTCRITDKYRIIIRQPEEGNLYLILWVDNHDEAMQWAENKVVHLNEHNHAIEIIDFKMFEEQSSTFEQIQSDLLFANYTYQQLADLGISEQHINLIQLMNTRENLDLVQPILPSRAYSYLVKLLDPEVSYDEVFALANHESYLTSEHMQTVVTQIEDVIDESINQEDYITYTEDDELLWILSEPLKTWRIFLHSSQRQIVETSVKGSVRVLGGAGTGKTVVAFHRIKWLIENVLKEGERLFFVTYTSTLKNDLRENLKSLLTSDQLKKVAVQTFDAWFKQFYKQNSKGPKKTIKYWSHTQVKQLWNSVLDQAPEGVSSDFLRMEWEQVILSQGITSLQGYLYASRVGRGVPLRKTQRREYWPFFQAYINALTQQGMIEREMAVWDIVRDALEGTVPFPYRCVVMDEAQDMSTGVFRLLRVLLPKQDNDLFIVGDGYQKIYSRPISMKQAGILIQGYPHSHRLRINYRTTDTIHETAMNIVQGQGIQDLDGETKGLKYYQSLILGNKPTICISSSKDERHQVFLDWLFNQEDLNQTCLVARTTKILDDYQSILEEQGYAISRLEEHENANVDEVGIRLASCHRVKGLEFKSVALVDTHPEFHPPYLEETGDVLYSKQILQEERSLVYVAMSRARDNLFVSWIG